MEPDKWFGEGMGGYATPLSSWGSPGYVTLVIGGHGWLETFKRTEVDGFICDLGRVLGWQMPKTRLPRVKMEKSRRLVRFSHTTLKEENVLSISEAKEMFVWLCDRFGWNDA